MCHTFKYFIHMQYFLLLTIVLSSLYTELALVCCTNTDNVHCFGTIFPNLTLFLRQSVPPVRSIFTPTNSEVDQLSNNDREQPKTALWLWVREMTWYLYTWGLALLTLSWDKNWDSHSLVNGYPSFYPRITFVAPSPEECADEWRQNNADLKLLENCAMNSFIMFGIMFMTATGLENSPVIWRLHCFTVSFRGDVHGEFGPRELASVSWRTPQWARGQFTRTIIPDWFEKWREIKFWYMC